MKKLLTIISALATTALLASPLAQAEMDMPMETFSDVGEAHENFVAIEYLVGIGTLEGYSDGTFKPDQTVNRAEIMKILVAGQGIDPDSETYNNCFPDVTDDWYAKYVCYAYDQGWVEGYPDGYFRPADTVNKVEALKMLVNALGLDGDLSEETFTELAFDDVSDGEWYAPYLWLALDMNLLEEAEGDSFDPDGDRDRGSIAKNLFRALAVMGMGADSYDDNVHRDFLDAEGRSELAYWWFEWDDQGTNFRCPLLYNVLPVEGMDTLYLNPAEEIPAETDAVVYWSSVTAIENVGSELELILKDYPNAEYESVMVGDWEMYRVQYYSDYAGYTFTEYLFSTETAPAAYRGTIDYLEDVLELQGATNFRFKAGLGEEELALDILGFWGDEQAG